MAGSIYNLFVNMSLAGNMSHGLATIATQLFGIHTTVGRINSAFDKWAVAIGGVATAMAGAGIVSGVAKLAEHGEKLLDQQVQMRNLNISQNEILKLQQGYYDNVAKAVPTSTVDEYLKTVKELRSVTGSPEQAAALAPRALMIDSLLSNASGHEVHGEFYKLLRSAEMKGISTSPERLQEFTDKAFQYILSFGGKLTAEDFQTIARRGGTAFMNADVDKALGPIAVLGADLGGSATGTALNTLEGFQMGRATLSKQQYATLEQLHLIDPSKVSSTGFGGGRKQLEPGAMVGSLEYTGDLPGWIKNIVFPAIQKAAHGDRAMEQQLLYKIFSNRNAGKLGMMFGDEGFLDQQRKDLGLAAQVLTPEEAYKNFTADNPKGVKKAFHDQYESMLESIGAPIMQAALPVMRGVTDMFTSIGKFANENPEKMKQIGIVIAGLGAALVVIGGIALSTLIGIPAAIAGVVAAVATIATLEWDKIRDGLMTLNNAITNFINWIEGIADRVTKFFDGNKPHKYEVDPNTGQMKLKKDTGFFSPAIPQPKVTPISLSLNVDGQTLAQTMSSLLQDMYTFANGAPAGDASALFQEPQDNRVRT